MRMSEERITLFAEILLPLPIPGSFTYRVPYELNDKAKVGQRAVVQFGKTKIMSGLIVSLTTEVPDCNNIKYLLDILDDDPVVNAQQLQLWNWISSYYLCYLGEVIQAALPSALKLSSESKIMLSEDFEVDSMTLSDNEFLIVEALQIQPQLTITEVSKIIGYKKVMPLIKTMIEKKIVVMQEELQQKYKAKYERYVRLSNTYRDEDKMHALMDGLSKRAYKQLELLMAFFVLGGSADNEVLASDLLKKADATSNILSALVDKGVFETYQKRVSRLKEYKALTDVSSIVLTEKQQEAYDAIHQGFDEEKPVLLHGVTASGKTEIYIKLIQEALDEGRQVLYLLPEIALTEQIINRLKKYFGDRVGVYHSRYDNNERVEIWQQVMNFRSQRVNESTGQQVVETQRLRDSETQRLGDSKYQIIIGSRSAVFLPFSDLGLIIVDEEHDSSFKQIDPAPRYSARDLAALMSKMFHARLLLGSATPSFESYFNAKQNKYHLVSLTERYGGVEMPEIIVDDLRVETRRKTMQANFGKTLVEAMNKTLEEKNQVILFQNRRGFSLRIECDHCNYIPQCINCDVSLIYHKNQNIMKCHYCGYTTSVPTECPNCHSTDLKMHGFGTERIEDDLKVVFPDANSARLDLDTTRTKNSYQYILEQFQNKETDILVGTQMVTKGLDFDSVKVVGVLNADNMLTFPDFRAYERSFQLMEQVSGRAGRKGDKGKVIIQTYQPYHPVILNVMSHDYVKFYEEQMPIRRQFNYPPYSRLVMIKLKDVDNIKLNKAASELAKIFRHVFKENLLGPEYPIVSRVKNQYIKQMIIKISKELNSNKVKDYIKNTIEDFKHNNEFKSVKIQIDVDPS
ncbi:MAG: primosomal protein N' [Lentimicrobiaceae bacterium]|nr:primosomal protein N' [Lentimicrobiaceae bacterium]